MNNLQGIATIINKLANPAVLATLVQTTGSSYRRPGARMLFDYSRIHTGNISAGCLEADILAQVESVMIDRSPRLTTYNMGSELDLIWGTGMGCQGNVDVLLEYVHPKKVPQWVDLYINIVKQRKTGVIATIFAIDGKCTDIKVGDHFVYDNENKSITPHLESLISAIEIILIETIQKGTANNIKVKMGNAKLSILLEPVLPPFALWIFGAGEHVRPIVSLAKKLGWFVGIIDHRPALATQERFPKADQIIVDHPPESLSGLPLDQRSAALIVSHIYEKDLEALRILLREPIPYLGLQGNRERSKALLRTLLGEVDLIKLKEQYHNLHFPAGLDIGAESPEAIAISMVAEIQAKLTGHNGESLRNRKGSIH